MVTVMPALSQTTSSSVIIAMFIMAPPEAPDAPDAAWGHGGKAGHHLLGKEGSAHLSFLVDYGFNELKLQLQRNRWMASSNFPCVHWLHWLEMNFRNLRRVYCRLCITDQHYLKEMVVDRFSNWIDPCRHCSTSWLHIIREITIQEIWCTQSHGKLDQPIRRAHAYTLNPWLCNDDFEIQCSM